MMSSFEVPKGDFKKMFIVLVYFWQRDNLRKYRPIKLGDLCLPKEQKSLGILDPETQNACLASGSLLINDQ